MADTDVVNCDLALETIKELTYTAATIDTDGDPEIFDITPTRRTGQICIVFTGVGAGADGNIDVSIAAGSYWAAGVALTATLTKNKTMLLFVETAKYLDANGDINVTLTPAATDKLVTDHTAKVGLIQLF